MSKEKFAEEMLLPRYEITFYPNVARNDLSFMHGSFDVNVSKIVCINILDIIGIVMYTLYFSPVLFLLYRIASRTSNSWLFIAHVLSNMILRTIVQYHQYMYVY